MSTSASRPPYSPANSTRQAQHTTPPRPNIPRNASSGYGRQVSLLFRNSIRAFSQNFMETGSRALCLHGWRSSNEVTAIQCANLGITSLFEVTYLHGPVASEKAADEFTSLFGGPYYSWLDHTIDDSDGNSSSPDHLERLEYQLVQSVQYIINYIQTNGPFDVVYGFSQGAALATILSSSKVLQYFGLAEVPWKAVICCCAAGVQSVLHTAQRVTGFDVMDISIPSCHLVGLQDDKKLESEHIARCFTLSPYSMYLDAGHELSANSLLNTSVRTELQLWLNLAEVSNGFDKLPNTTVTSSDENNVHFRVSKELALWQGPESKLVKTLSRSHSYSPEHTVNSITSPFLVSRHGQLVYTNPNVGYGERSQWDMLRAQAAGAVAIRAHNNDDVTTFGQLLGMIDHAANLVRLGVKEGDTVAYLTPHGPLGAVAFLVLGSQTTVAPLDPNLTVQELVQALQQLNAKVLVTFDCLASSDAGMQAAEKTGVPLFVARAVGLAGQFEWDLKDDMAPTPTPSPLVCKKDQVLFMVRTSGTTSIPKVVPLVNCSVMRNAELLGRTLHLTKDDISLNAMPLFHVGGIYANLLASLCQGGSCICMPAFNAEVFVQTLSRASNRPTWYSAVPTIHAMVLSTITEKYGLNAIGFSHSLRFIRSGAAALSHDVALSMQQLFQCPIIPTYAMSEQMPITQCPADYALDKVNSVGVPVGVSLCVVNSLLRVLGYGERGEICISGPTVLQGYRDNDQANRTGYFVCNGMMWFRTGDVGYLDEGGFLFITGREKELVKRGGEQVSPYEVEDICCKFPGVAVCVVFAVPSAFWGQEVGAAIVLSKDLVEQENFDEKAFFANLKAFCSQEGLQAYKIPQYLKVVNQEDLPKTSTKKYVRLGLAKKLNVVSDTEVNATFVSDYRAVPISSALSGARVFLGFWIMYNHIGRRDQGGLENWYDGRGWCSHVPAFIILGGFLLAASTTAPMVASGKLLQFYKMRFLAIYPMYFISILVAIFTFLFYCHPDSYKHPFIYGKQDLCRAPPIEMNWGGSFFLTLVSYFLGLQAWPFMIPLTFFLSYYSFYNSIYYFCIWLFPYMQRYLLQVKNNVAEIWRFVCIAMVCQCLYEVLHGMYWPIRAANYEAAGYFSLFMYLFPPFWLPLFAIGVGSYFLFAHYRPFDSHNKKYWGYLTDFFSLVYLGGVLLWIEDTDSAYPQSSVKTPQDVRYWASFISRLISPMTCLWIYGLAIGEGYSAMLTSHPIFSEVLGPCFYCVYLFHQVISQWYYKATRGSWAAVPKPFYWFSPVAVPVGIGEFFAIVFIVIGICYLIETYFHPILLTYTNTCINRLLPGDHGGNKDDSVTDTILRLVSNVVGHELTLDSNLIHSGLGSLTTIVLVAEIKGMYADIQISAADVYASTTVQDLVKLVEEKVSRQKSVNIV
ncbi:hypothetical protein EON65_24060 [archaeon]|nr:MAG: hypothetical protein EON65_24060 [archaeon]